MPRTPAAEWLENKIRANGPISFAEYMAACLYHPEFGYYTSAESRPRRDYYTSPSLHPIFGELIARQLHEMWKILDSPRDFYVIELAAGDGLLAGHILDFAASYLAEFYGALCYVGVEISAPRRQEAAKRLERHVLAGGACVQDEMPTAIPAGCVLSNEFFDALPVHVAEWNGMRLLESFVDCDENGRFREKLDEPSLPDISEYFSGLGVKFARGQRAEAGLSACRWMDDIGARLGRGFVLTVDYGHEAAELYHARRAGGTLLAYRNHRAGEDVFAAPAEQDLTAHVNFTALERAGCGVGLQRTGLVFQTNFLLALARRFGLGNPESRNDAEALKERAAFTNLIHPEGMGETFRVLVQHKGIEKPQLTGLEPL
jgi:SAM-dependent MidA family methyltransferase